MDIIDSGPVLSVLFIIYALSEVSDMLGKLKTKIAHGLGIEEEDARLNYYIIVCIVSGTARMSFCPFYVIVSIVSGTARMSCCP
jgi:hypothetical protein